MPLNWYTKAEDVLPERDLSGLVAVVTGANTGIGLETARVLLKQGARVILACRDVGKARLAVHTLPNPDRAEVMSLDLASLTSVTQFCHDFAARHTILHILVCNAGVMATPYTRTQDGFELQFGVNYLGHFHLVELLLPGLEAAPQGGRIIHVSSMGHRISMFDMEDLQAERYAGTKRYDFYYKWIQYGNSKLAQILHTIELNRRLRERDSKVRIYAVHPGCILTNLFQHVTVIYWICMIFTFLCKSIEQGAATTIFCAVHPTVEGHSGGYFKDCRLTRPILPLKHSEKARELYDISKKLIGGVLNNSKTDG